jgi:eukaryotic translation initiation factor 2C
MREHPSRKYTQIKKSFFQRGEKRYDLGKGVEAFKGVFSSLRPVLDDKSGKSLAVNVDVANGTFWHAQPLPATLCQMFGVQLPALIQLFKEGKKNWKESRFKKDLRPLKRMGVTANHAKAQFTIEEIVDKDATEMRIPDPNDCREGL